MGDKRRTNSPVSENTIAEFARQSGLNIDFSGCENEGSISSLSNSESEVIDDTDEDPTFDPLVPGPSSGIAGRGNRLRLFLDSRRRPTRPRPMIDTSDSEADDPEPTRPITVARGRRPRSIRGGRRRGTNRPRPRPRPQQNVTDDSSSWDEAEEGRDRPYEHEFQFLEHCGPKHCPLPNSKPISYFNLFITTTLLQMFVDNTNRYAQKFIGNFDDLSPHSRIRKWVDVSLLEMKAFLGIILNMGLIRKPSIKSYWDNHFSSATPFFSKMMCRDRFQAILKFFHIVDVDMLAKHGEPGYDPCGRFQPIIDYATKNSNFIIIQPRLYLWTSPWLVPRNASH